MTENPPRAVTPCPEHSARAERWQAHRAIATALAAEGGTAWPGSADD
ncbi:hypothetical protein [Streptomyces luteolus]|uniref:Uncharacterized protein n=1 Tax=Streptomyces luteolus TaxID=3043615 RepID=A0ABT6SW54_9ACTN|nr:hypothetical protein [Streptomyces sp. B-S-A12]MDI3419816.1 hypothetical protein [Streptomyces sp. B-S-A12]